MFRVFIFVWSLFLSLFCVVKVFCRRPKALFREERERERELDQPFCLLFQQHIALLFVSFLPSSFTSLSSKALSSVWESSRSLSRRRRRLVVREKIRTLSKDAPTRETKLLSPPRDASETRPRRSGVLFFVLVFSI